LGPRALNRALLARQMLLDRDARPAIEAIERLVGLQAQAPRSPFVALWSRLEGFRRDDLSRAAAQSAVVRGTLMRGTLHLVSRHDYVRFRLTLQPMLTAVERAIVRRRLDGVDLDSVMDDARAWFGERPRTFEALRAHLERRFADADTRALAYAVRMQLPLLQMPDPAAPWGYPARADFTVAEPWLGTPLSRADATEALMVRYVAAYGPASVQDAQTWSGMTGLGPVFERLRPALLAFRDERGRELFDLPQAPRPESEEEAPPRFLAEWDTLLLSHADRSRLIADAHRAAISTANLRVPGTFLVDGFVAGLWTATRKKAAVTLDLQPFARLAARDRARLEQEGESLLRFLEPGAGRADVRVGRTSGSA
jgi:hypothetical protein